MSIQLEDMVFSYPDSKTRGIQTLISAKEEFRQVGSDITESVPKRGQLFKHQTFLLRYMRQYDDQLIIWRTGTGKSCGVISVTEYYKNLIGSLEIMRKDAKSPYDHAYVLVKGKGLVQEFKNQLVCKCTDGDYITPQILESKTESARKGNITRSVGRYYSIMTYGSLASELVKLTDDQMKQRFSNCIFIVDEVHNLKYEKPDAPLSVDPTTGNKIAVSRTTNVETGVVKERIMDSRLTYDQLWRVFHKVTPRKVMLLSATPMINDSSEIGPILNLLLSEEYQLPYNLDYKRITLEQFEPYIRGLISYVRELDTGAISRYQGKAMKAEYMIDGKKVKSQLIVYASGMIGKQEETYKLSVSDPKALRPESDKPGAFSDLQRQASNFVFPDGSTGGNGFKKYVKKSKNKYMATHELLPWIENPDYLRQLSSKYTEIVRLVRQNTGNAWCYSHFVEGSGAVVLGLCFKAQGFDEFTESNSIFTSTGSRRLAPLCSSPQVESGRTVRIPKKLRYAVLTSVTSEPEAAAILEAFNSPENIDGEYIKAIIGSPVTRDGLNLANVLQIHLVGPEWNNASTYQAISRAIRSTSHVDLIARKTLELEKEGKDTNNVQVDIKIYRHAAVANDVKSVDLEMYQLSEVKNREISRIMRMLKQVSVDCQVHYNRNVRSTDVDGTETCDYEVCRYKCFDPTPTSIDYTSFDVLYAGDIIRDVTTEIKRVFRTVFTVSYDRLYHVLQNYRQEFVDRAVTNMIVDKVLITDRYGYNSYLAEDGGYLFLRRDYPLDDSDLSISSYTSYLIGVQKSSLSDYNTSLQRGTQIEMIQRLEKVPIDSPEFEQIMSNIDLAGRIILVENAIVEFYINRRDSPLLRNIINRNKNSIFQVPEPVKAIEIAAEALANRGKGRGRKPKAGSRFKLNAKQQEEIDRVVEPKDAETVYIHTLYGQKVDRTSYAVSSTFSKSEDRIRLLKASEGGEWRDANPYELPVYNNIIMKKLESMKNVFEEHEIYGTILKDGKFRIIDRSTEDKRKSKTDKRSVNRGKICDIWPMPNLLEIIWKLNFMPFNVDVQKTRDEMLETLKSSRSLKKLPLDTFSDEKLEFFYVWNESGQKRSDICALLQNFLREEGKLFELEN